MSRFGVYLGYVTIPIFMMMLATHDNKKIKAIYGFKHDLGPFKDKKENEIVAELKRLGVNAVFGDFKDSLLVDALHRAGIRVFADVNVFVGELYWIEHPESRPINAKGKRIEKIEWYAGVCPNQSWLREEKLKAIEELITKYDIDGIWLDFIRYPCHWEMVNPKLEQTCFCPVCLSLFQKETGIIIPENCQTVAEKAEWLLARYVKDWTKWKCGQITKFVQEARSIMKQKNKDILLGIFTVPWMSDDYDNAIQRIIGQDYEGLADYVDVFSPMTYHKMCGRSVSWIQSLVDTVHKMTGKKVWPIIQACSVPDELTDKEFEQVLRIGLGSQSSGVIVFSYKHLVKENKLESLRKIFKQ
jgi:uncharacterized lipoprotein YddW (UPF0748 family)